MEVRSSPGDWIIRRLVAFSGCWFSKKTTAERKNKGERGLVREATFTPRAIFRAAPWLTGLLEEARSFHVSAEPPENVGKTEVPVRKFDMIQSEIPGLDNSEKQFKFFSEKKRKGNFKLLFILCHNLILGIWVQTRPITLKFLGKKSSAWLKTK